MTVALDIGIHLRIKTWIVHGRITSVGINVFSFTFDEPIPFEGYDHLIYDGRLTLNLGLYRS